jgi:hypothetical protein
MKIVNLLFLLLALSIVKQKALAQKQGCNEAFTAVYQNLHATSEDNYLKTLFEIYQSKSQGEVDSRTSNAGGITVPRYGSADWSSNKSTVTKVYNSYDWKRQVFLSENHKAELTKTYYDPSVAIKAIDAWERCKRPSGMPEISHISDDSIVTISLQMNSWFCKTTEKLDVRNISFSANLVLDTLNSDFKKNSKLTCEGTYQLKFKRLDKGINESYVSVALSKFDALTERIYPDAKEPVVQVQPAKDNHIEYPVTFNIPKNWMKIFVPDFTQVVTYPNNTGFYDIHFSFETDIAADKVKDLTWSFNKEDGIIARNETRTYSIRNNKIVLNGFIQVKKMTKGKIEINYTVRD